MCFFVLVIMKEHREREKCIDFIRKGHCKWGKQCRYDHKRPKAQKYSFPRTVPKLTNAAPKREDSQERCKSWLRVDRGENLTASRVYMPVSLPEGVNAFFDMSFAELLMCVTHSLGEHGNPDHVLIAK